MYVLKTVCFAGGWGRSEGVGEGGGGGGWGELHSLGASRFQNRHFPIALHTRARTHTHTHTCTQHTPPTPLHPPTHRMDVAIKHNLASLGRTEYRSDILSKLAAKSVLSLKVDTLPSLKANLSHDTMKLSSYAGPDV